MQNLKTSNVVSQIGEKKNMQKNLDLETNQQQ